MLSVIDSLSIDVQRGLSKFVEPILNLKTAQLLCFVEQLCLKADRYISVMCDVIGGHSSHYYDVFIPDQLL